MLSGGSADALLNSVALGFVLEVDDLMYHAFIPDVNKRMVGHMPGGGNTDADRRSAALS
jgi:hypothetical protein